MSDALVSIVIPACNPVFFPAALRSALAQTYRNIEVIVCDDSGADLIRQAFDIAVQNTDVSMRYVRTTQRLGFAGNLLRCMTEAKGEFLKFLCDDDLLFTHCIELQQAALTGHGEASLVLGQRHFRDADDFNLPSRFENSPLVSKDTLFKGHDLLALLEIYPANFLGNLSSALFRTADVTTFLPVLTQSAQCFVARLDLALFVCAMSRGNLIVLSQVIAIERLHNARLSFQQSVRNLVATETRWLVEMLAARTAESPPAQGWVSWVLLNDAATEPRVWNERHLNQDLGTRQRALLTKVGTQSESFAQLYEEWLSCRTLTPGQIRLLPDIVALWSSRPKIVPIVVCATDHQAALQMTLDSIGSQHYAPELVIVLSTQCEQPLLDGNVFSLPLQTDVASQLNDLLAQLQNADWIYVLEAGDRLAASALLILADRIVHGPGISCMYSDEGALHYGESAEPVFKPAFNLDLLRSYPYVGRVLAFERISVLACAGFDSNAAGLATLDMLWRLFERTGAQAIGHVAQVLVESQFSFGQWLASPSVVNNSLRVVQAHLQRSGVAHRVESAERQWVNRVEYVHSQQPLVTIVLVVQDQLAVLQRCLESILRNTAYGNFEILLADNGSQDIRIHDWLVGMSQLGSNKLRVMTLAAQPLGQVLNNAIAQANGHYVVVVSPYVVANRSDWLTEMLHHAQRSEVAAVGPLVSNADGSVRDAGLVLGLNNCAGHAFKGEPVHSQGYMARLTVAQDLSALGVDCLLLDREVFSQLGGFDSERYGDEGFALDFCLRAGAQGYLIVWTPFARLLRGEAPGDTFQPFAHAETQSALQQQWLATLARDPAYNPNLTLDGLGFTLDSGLRNGWTPFTNRPLPSILALPINATAVGHYRLIQPFTELEGAGRIVGKICFETPNWIEIERQEPDLIILQGRYTVDSPGEIANFRKYTRARLIYELDDYVLNVPAKNSHVRKRVSNMEEILRQSISQCDRLVVSTEALADALRGMHVDTRVVPNMLAPHLWSGLRSLRRTSRKPRVGWGGGTSHTGDLELIAEVVKRLSNDVDWIFFGMCPDMLRPYIHEFHEVVGMAEYPAKLASLNLDLALAPLEHHVFNDCKSNLRLLEYGACGYPVICSDTLAYRGYLPCTRLVSNTTEQWVEAIRAHLADPDASYRQGDALREAVLRDYMLRADNLRHWEDAWLS